MSRKRKVTDIKFYSDHEAEMLADAMIIQAVKDYRDWKKQKKWLEQDMQSLGSFFNSKWAETVARDLDIKEVYMRLKKEPIYDEDIKEIYKKLDGVFWRDNKNIAVAKNGKLIMIIGVGQESIDRHKIQILNMIEDVNKELGIDELRTAQNVTKGGV